MRMFAVVVVGLGLGASSASGQGSQCMYANQLFSVGSVSCQDGQQYQCVAGAWKANGLGCADTKADADQPGMNVDPSRRAPGVRQPAPPSVPRD
jgi:hypothetical protein